MRESLLSLLRLLRRWLVDRTDDERINGRGLAGEPGGGDRSGRDQDALADAAAQNVEGDEPRALAVLQLDLQHGAARDLLQALGGPHVADDDCPLHGHSLSISTPSCRALSRASGVTTTPLPTTSRLPALAAAMTLFSVTMPLSTRSPPPGAGSASTALRARFSRNLSRPAWIASRWSSTRRTKAASSASVAMLTSSTFAASEPAARASVLFFGADTSAARATIFSRTASGSASRSTCRTIARIASRSIDLSALIAAPPAPVRPPGRPRECSIRCRSDRRGRWRPSCGSRRP